MIRIWSFEAASATTNASLYMPANTSVVLSPFKTSDFLRLIRTGGFQPNYDVTT